MKKIASFWLSGSIDVTDPCYDRDVWCRMNGIEITPGTYECFIEEGERVFHSMILHEAYLNEKLEEKTIGEIGVDAGLAGYFINKPDFTDEEWSNLCDEMFAKDSPLQVGKRCYLETKRFTGFWTESGFGDGVYPVFALVCENKIVGLEMYF